GSRSISVSAARARSARGSASSPARRRPTIAAVWSERETLTRHARPCAGHPRLETQTNQRRGWPGHPRDEVPGGGHDEAERWYHLNPSGTPGRYPAGGLSFANESSPCAL